MDDYCSYLTSSPAWADTCNANLSHSDRWKKKSQNSFDLHSWWLRMLNTFSVSPPLSFIFLQLANLGFWQEWPVGSQKEPARVAKVNKAIGWGRKVSRGKWMGSPRDGVWEAAVGVLLQIWEWDSENGPIRAEGAVRICFQPTCCPEQLVPGFQGTGFIVLY